MRRHEAAGTTSAWEMARHAFRQLGRFATRGVGIVSRFIWIESDASDHLCEPEPLELPIGGSGRDLEVRSSPGEVQLSRWGE